MGKVYYQQEPNPKLSGIIKSFWQIDKEEDVAIIVDSTRSESSQNY